MVLSFWAPWCAPCLREIPKLARLHRQIEHDGGMVVGVALVSGSAAQVRRRVEEEGVDFPVWLSDPEAAGRHYVLGSLPTTVIVDREGVVRRRYEGAQPADSLLRAVGELL